MRIWGRPWQPIGAPGEAEHDHHFIGGKVVREREKAGWLHSAYAAPACVRGCAPVSLCLDIAKLYVSLRRDFLWRCGRGRAWFRPAGTSRSARALPEAAHPPLRWPGHR
eukprot:1553796-Pyramimonas_sp.AAC.1